MDLKFAINLCHDQLPQHVRASKKTAEAENKQTKKKNPTFLMIEFENENSLLYYFYLANK